MDKADERVGKFNCSRGKMKPIHPTLCKSLLCHAMPSKAVLKWDPRPKNVSRTANEILLNSSQRVRNNTFVRFVGTLLHQKPQEEASVAERSVRDLRHMPRFHEPLQYNHHEERMREERRQPSLLASPSSISEDDECPTEELESRKRRVSFDESVVVVPVPPRRDYSEQLSAKLWSNSVELCENIGKCVPKSDPFRSDVRTSSYLAELKPILFLPA